MNKNFFRVAFRNLFRQRTYSLFNLIGLSLGIACGLLLTLHIKEELSYEKNFSRHDRIYRVASTEWSKTAPSLAAELPKGFPNLKRVVRFADRGTSVVNTMNNRQAESKGYYTDSSAIDMFDMKRLAGDPVKALAEPNAVVITESMAKKLFANQNPLGQKLIFGDNEELWVRAVIADLQGNSHIQFDYLCSMSTFYKYVSPDWMNNKHWMFGWTYVEFDKPINIPQAEKQLADFYLRFDGITKPSREELEGARTARFQPITSIHLGSDLIQEMGANSSITYIYIFMAVEVLILLIACVNFINLFTTQALKRLKEVGMRKLLGASKSQVVAQFMGEAFILTILAGLLAVLLYEVSLPFYNHITARQVTPWEIVKPDNLLIIAATVVFVGFISGIFPAVFVSKFKPVSTLKALRTPRSSATYLRKGLVVFQFMVSGFLIISTVLIFQQMRLFKNKKMGFDKDQVLVVKMYGKLKDKMDGDPEVLKNELLKNPNIVSIGKSSNLIGDDLSVESVVPLNPIAGFEYPNVRVMRVDENYIPVMKIELKAGRNFSPEFHDTAAFIINEKAARELRLSDPLNTPVSNSSMGIANGKIVGIIKDFHFASLHHQVEPLVLQYKPAWTGNMLVKIRADKTQETIAFLKTKIAAVSPNTLFRYEFLDDHVSRLYQKEDNMSQILKLFAALAIVISCLGLFGLIAHATETRTKEIGIRKVIGAGVGNLISLLSRDLLFLVLLGNLIAWPIAWWLTNKWLEEFTDRISIGWGVFAGSLGVTLVVALITMAYHCLRAANANPVRSLRAE